MEALRATKFRLLEELRKGVELVEQHEQALENLRRQVRDVQAALAAIDEATKTAQMAADMAAKGDGGEEDDDG